MTKSSSTFCGRTVRGLTLQNIFKELGVQRKERAKIEAHLLDLEGKKLIRRVRNRYLLPAESDLVRGRFETFGRGFGFVIRESGKGEDVYVPARLAKGAMHGDAVEILARESGGRGGRNEGRVVRILKKERKSIVGVFNERQGAPYIAPFDAACVEEIPLVSRGSLFPKPGMIVAADRGRLVLTDVFGFPDDPGVDTRVVIRKYGLAEAFPEAILAEAEETAARPRDAEGRADYRGWTTFTIDGETAQDFDDAVSIRPLESGRALLGVHIADVSHYVRPGTALDRAAFERGTSVYFPGLTLPMLPERLSNDVCSLRPRQDRLTMSVLLEIGPDGCVERSEFHPSIIRTAERLTYASVFKIFEGDAAERARLAPLVPDLLAMRELARRLRARRLQAGSLDFDLLEPELVYQEGRLSSITTFAQNEAHKLIEEFMVTANVAVATHLSRRKVPSIFRVHPPPAEGDLEKLRNTLLPFGIILPPADKIRSADLQAAIRAAEGTPAGKFVNVQILRAMRLAAYSEKNAGHFGLAQSSYTHFTSPDPPLSRPRRPSDPPGRPARSRGPSRHRPALLGGGAQGRRGRAGARRMEDLPLSQGQAGRGVRRDGRGYRPGRPARRARRSLCPRPPGVRRHRRAGRASRQAPGLGGPEIETEDRARPACPGRPGRGRPAPEADDPRPGVDATPDFLYNGSRALTNDHERKKREEEAAPEQGRAQARNRRGPPDRPGP